MSRYGNTWHYQRRIDGIDNRRFEFYARCARRQFSYLSMHCTPEACENFQSSIVDRQLAFDGTPNLFVMRGGMQRKKLAEIQRTYSAVQEGERRLLLATDRFLGEGFDDSLLDTLLLTMPI